MNKSSVARQQGDHGSVLVFLHYFGGAADSWQWVVSDLASDYTCFVLNLPGFGSTPPLSALSIASYTQWITKTLESLGLSACTLVGHSMSGKLALSVAATNPDHINHVVLVAPSPPTQEPMEEAERQRMLNHPNLSEAIKTVKGATRAVLTEEQRSLAIATQLAVDHPTWRWWLTDGMNYSIADQVARIKTPVHLLASKDDPVIPFRPLCAELKKLIPHIQINAIKNIGHLLPLEEPKWLASQIKNIVRQKI
ncbi:alpha/beta fold hydrolase [Tunicatimonas pelagia]|uniref:alpha/beta fold hydrolase n=1 Tax=Tunicatimonas pelagia TaxID=931531 RepID=UPI0026651986|nr:alpha/beta hydrolase [Tunicatimonas pelagia]WKN43277.1 alpha/beta hydrolase [Tunicatimonas pelagia]